MKYLIISIFLLLIYEQTFSKSELDFIRVEGEIIDRLTNTKIHTKVKIGIFSNKGYNTEIYSNNNGEFSYDSLVKGNKYQLHFEKRLYFNKVVEFVANNDTILYIVLDNLPVSVSYLPIVFFEKNKSQLDKSYNDSLQGFVSSMNNADYKLKIIGFKDTYELPGIDSLRAVELANMLIELGLDSSKISMIKASKKPNHTRTNEVLKNQLTGENIRGIEVSEANIWLLRNYIENEESLRKWNRSVIIEIDFE